MSELINLTDKHIDVNNQIIDVIGKRNKQSIIPIPDNLVKVYHEYYLERAKITSVPYCLFITNKNKPCYPMLIQRIVRKILKENMILNKYNPHVIRPTYATHLMKQGADIHYQELIRSREYIIDANIHSCNNAKNIRSL